MRTGFFLSAVFQSVDFAILVDICGIHFYNHLPGEIILKLLFAAVIFIAAVISPAITHSNTVYGFKSEVPSAFQDTSSTFKLTKGDSAALQAPFSLDESVNAQVTYMKNCQMCHGVDRMGASAPSLYRLDKRVNFNYFKDIVSAGRAQMPGFRLLDSKTLVALYKYLSDLPVKDTSQKPIEKDQKKEK